MATSFEAVTLRPITEGDHPFLLALYGTVREPELAPLPWTREEKDAFVRQQFDAQHAWWQGQYQDTTYDVVLVDGEPAGRLYVGRWAQTVRIVDIALMPRFRNTGLGTRLLREVFEEADAMGKPVSIHVERFNPAMRLYQRLGFVEIEDKGIYALMERPVGATRA